MLNDFFSTVFTREDAKSAPVLKPLCDAKLVDIEVSVDVIMKKLSSLKEDKAAGDDNMSPRLLKAIAAEIAYPVAMIFQQQLSYRKQIVRQLRTQFVEDISVTLKSTLRVIQGRWKRNHWTDHTRLTVRQVIGR